MKKVTIITVDFNLLSILIYYSLEVLQNKEILLLNLRHFLACLAILSIQVLEQVI
ncbi:hypothetical protein UT300019_15480 [Clostridium sp. CTA-19]